MKIVRCPDSHQIDQNPVLFLAGGISNCADWQEEMIEMFRSDPKEIVLINPRRVGFDTEDRSMAEDQIEWEYFYLEMATAVSFWFPRETLCPITLFELGKAAAQGKKIYVGCHPEYQRVFDVKKQIQLLRPDVHVHDDLRALTNTIIGHLNIGML